MLASYRWPLIASAVDTMASQRIATCTNARAGTGWDISRARS